MKNCVRKHLKRLRYEDLRDLEAKYKKILEEKPRGIDLEYCKIWFKNIRLEILRRDKNACKRLG